MKVGVPSVCESFGVFLNSEMSRSGDGSQEGERREDDQGPPTEGAAGAVTPAMLEQLESRLVEKIVAQLAAQGNPKGAADTSASAKEGEPGAAVGRLVLKGNGHVGRSPKASCARQQLRLLV